MGEGSAGRVGAGAIHRPAGAQILRPAARLLTLLLLYGAPALAQRSASLDIRLPEPISRVTDEGPLVLAQDMLAGSRMREPLAAGFPARFHFRVELWAIGGLFNNLEKSFEYDVLVRFLAVEKVYEVLLIDKDRPPFSLGKYVQVDDAERAVARPRRIPLTATQRNRAMYYQVTLAADNVDMSDIDDLNRWLRGEVRPAISGERNPGTAVSRTLRSFAARLLGGGTREYSATTPRFRTP